ncbi:histone H2A deubiquitinase MYSM1 isoform X2 [Latimeria chalumnae]|uniref:histone H2A deubiquitinase MYSM1 isoform X2 n=1 Tax=Latimeria chalumnae TaxID=7897 RepID=UPI00313E799E
MAEEADVDIEGDESELSLGEPEGAAAEFMQDHYLESSWRTGNELIPWTLDSSISEENRAAIEKMLLEEEYYLTGKKHAQKCWSGQAETKQTSISPSRRFSQKKARKIQSPTKPTSCPVKWTPEEKELFERGLGTFGRRWTKIAKLIGSRTVLQVKNYARQYFKNKAKPDPSVKGMSSLFSGQMLSSLVESDEKEEAESKPSLFRGRADPNLNAVKIENLSDDEDVDITDEVDDPGQSDTDKKELSDACHSLAKENQPVECISEPEGEEMGKLPASVQETSSKAPVIDVPAVGHSCDVGALSENNGIRDEVLQPLHFMECKSCPVNCEEHGDLWAESYSHDELCETQAEVPFCNEMLLQSPCQVDEENQEEEEELKPPEQEIQMDREVITEEEKQAIPEFFEGRQSKTPERYLKIRNYILDQWEKCKPKYLNKTSVRPGLKNCGDVNCIGRIHTYLELIGGINFGCEQAVYNRPRPVDKTRSKEGKDNIEAYQLAQRLQSMRTRRRRVRDPWGNWCDAKELEGQTFEHLSAEELAKRRDEEKNRPAKAAKAMRQIKSTFDPFQLIPCCSFNESKQQPFLVKVAAEVLLIMDMHSHVSMAEVIGLLGGHYSDTDKVLEVCAAEPCCSLSTGLQCEMDPVSQTQASETLAVRGYNVVGWYHSHPAFDPNPSIRDIDTQAKYQSYFSRGGAQFVGMIISPYNQNNPSPYSQVNCLIISDELSPDGSYRLPYKFDVQHSLKEPQWTQVLAKAQWIIEKYRLLHSIPMERLFRRDSNLTCLQKLAECMRKTLGNLDNNRITEQFLTQIENLFSSEYKTEETDYTTEESTSPQAY